MGLIVQIIVSIAVCVAAGYAFYMYFSKQGLLTKKNNITYCVVVQLLIAAALLYRYMGLCKTDFFGMINHFVILECTALVTVTDFRKQIIPNRIMLMALYLRGLLLIPEFIVFREDILSILIRNLVACIVPTVLLIMGLLIMKNSIGMGDVKLLFIIALFSDFLFVFNALFYALVVAFIVSVVLLLTKKIKAKGTIAFAPFLLVGVYLAVILNVS